jgi:hypothetical protein
MNHSAGICKEAVVFICKVLSQHSFQETERKCKHSASTDERQPRFQSVNARQNSCRCANSLDKLNVETPFQEAHALSFQKLSVHTERSPARIRATIRNAFCYHHISIEGWNLQLSCNGEPTICNLLVSKGQIIPGVMCSNCVPPHIEQKGRFLKQVVVEM